MALFAFLFLAGCTNLPSSPDDTAPSGTTPESANLQVAPVDSDDCPGCDSVRKIIDEYRINPIRAQDTYTGERVRIGGRIKSLDERKWPSSAGREAGRSISVALENGIRFGFEDSKYSSTRADAFHDWRDWLLLKNIGDVIEAECTIEMLASAKHQPDYVLGTPILDYCNRVVAGKVIVTPTPSP